MKNSDKYKQAASRITPSANMNVMNYIEEKETKRMMKTPVLRRALAVCMSLLFAIGFGYTAYAADFGGIRRPIDLWLHGSMDEVTIEDAGDGQFNITYSDGSVHSVGGFAYEGDAARPLTEDEIIDLLLKQAEVEQDENGSYWLYLRDHKIDITESLLKQGYAQEKIQDGFLADFITVVLHDEDSWGVMTDHFSFPSPEEVRDNTR